MRKRELITFISRPVTRLPRLNLILEQVQKYTPEGRSPYLLLKRDFFLSVDTDHIDHETMPLILGILSDFLKSTQPGIQAAEERVKFFTLGENLVFRKSEIIVSPFPRRRSDLTSIVSQDLDFYGETRTVAHEGTVGRKEKADSFSRERWVDNSAKLLDHYCTCVLIRLFLAG